MNSTARRARGFTLMEMVVVLGLIAIITAMTYGASVKQQHAPRITSAILDLRGLFAHARQEALATGRDVVVMVFPDFPNPSRGTGRVISYMDGDGTFFSNAGVVNFAGYDPTGTATGPNSEVLQVLDLDFGTAFGPATGQGTGVVLAAPFALLPVDADCTFCAGAPRRGAVVFDHAGRASFRSANGPALVAPVGGSLTVRSVTWNDEVRTLAVVAGSGALRTLTHKLP